MNQQSGWGYPMTDPMYNFAQTQSPFTSNISSYFRRPAKIVKPSSRNTSPKHLGRRRTTTAPNAGIGRTRSVLDRQRVGTQSSQQQYSRQAGSRPLSWHPSTYPDFTSQIHDTSFFTGNDVYQQGNLYGTTATHGQYTPLSQPIVDEPQIHELITPLESLSAHEMNQAALNSAYPTQYWLPQDLTKQEFTMDAMFPQQPIMQVPSWHWNTLGQDLPTAPSSPNFLPIQGAIDASPLDLNTKAGPPTKTDGEELVSLGLYDSPAEVQSSSLLFGGGLNGLRRKRSLKLEEAFEPAEKDDKAAPGDAGSEEDGTVEDDEADISEPDESFPIFHDQTQIPEIPNLAGQSFFFDEKSRASHGFDTTDLQGSHDVYPALAMSYLMSGSGAGLPLQGAGYGWF